MLFGNDRSPVLWRKVIRNMGPSRLPTAHLTTQISWANVPSLFDLSFACPGGAQHVQRVGTDPVHQEADAGGVFL
jgi:hypothetical protein